MRPFHLGDVKFVNMTAYWTHQGKCWSKVNRETSIWGMFLLQGSINAGNMQKKDDLDKVSKYGLTLNSQLSLATGF